ncbi:MAG: hypothetical protein WEB60_07995 [Terrimicrobiaceae bacterium]
MLQPWMIAEDLAPGDMKSVARDWSDVCLQRIDSAKNPHFAMAYGKLWEEFGEIDEMEEEPVIISRLAWDGTEMEGGCALRYRLMLVLAGEAFAAVRDHTVIVSEGIPGAVVHLSHNLVAPEWRRSGLAGWLRALPIQTARQALKAQHRSAEEPITLVGEMEHPDPQDKATMVRLSAYERAGFLKADPRVIPYHQPDFRSSAEIDDSGGARPLPMQLLLRRVGREHERDVETKEILRLAGTLYRMYSRGFRSKDMEVAYRTLKDYPTPETKVALLPPTA